MEKLTHNKNFACLFVLTLHEGETRDENSKNVVFPVLDLP